MLQHNSYFVMTKTMKGAFRNMKTKSSTIDQLLVLLQQLKKKKSKPCNRRLRTMKKQPTQESWDLIQHHDAKNDCDSNDNIIIESDLGARNDAVNDPDILDTSERLSVISTPTPDFGEESYDNGSKAFSWRRHFPDIEYEYEDHCCGPVFDDVVSYIYQKGFTAYLQKAIGGLRKESDAKTAMNRLAAFLIWSYHFAKQSPINSRDSIIWMAEMVKCRYYLSVLPKYVEYCEEKRQFKGSTIKNHLGDLNTAFKWLVFHFSTENSYEGAEKINLSNEDLLGIENVLKQLRRCYHKKMIKEKSTLSAYETKVSEGYIPSGDKPLQELQVAVSKEFCWASQIRRRILHENYQLERQDYNLFVGLVVASFYVFSVQGRIGAFSSLKLHQVKDFRSNGYSTSTNFKNNSTWGYQPIIVNDDTLKLVDIYVNEIREQVVKRTANDNFNTESCLFINYDGRPFTSLSKLVIHFFRKKLRLNTNSTILRSLMETEASRLHDQGKISAEARKAVSNINCHSGEIVDQYYLKKKKKDEVALSREVMTAFLHDNSNNLKSTINLHTDSDSDSDCSSDSDFHDDCSPRRLAFETSDAIENSPIHPIDASWLSFPTSASRGHTATITATIPQTDTSCSFPTLTTWGRNHPDNQREGGDGKRITWTPEETDYVGTLGLSLIKNNPEAKTHLMATMLKIIKKDPDARHIFHPHHVAYSARLKSGFNKYMEKRNGL